MTTGTLNSPPSSDRDYLEMLMNKIKVMKQTGAQYYANKSMDANKRIFDAAKREVNEFYTLLVKRGYDPSRYDKPKVVQPKLYEQK
jgi:hypothetical protein